MEKNHKSFLDKSFNDNVHNNNCVYGIIKQNSHEIARIATKIAYIVAVGMKFDLLLVADRN